MERQSMTGPNHVASDCIQDPRATRHDCRAASRDAVLGALHSVSTDCFRPAVSWVSSWYVGTMTSSVKLISTSLSEGPLLEPHPARRSKSATRTETHMAKAYFNLY